MSRKSDKAFRALYDAARAAGLAAGRGASPDTFVVTDRGRPVDVLHDGLCGFAWVTVAGNTSFGRWARKAGLARPGYPKGLSFWVGDFNQSHDRKYAYASAFARVLNDAGVTAYSGSRLD